MCGHFGVIIRENAEMVVYRGNYGKISANRTLLKLEKEYGYLKRIMRGKNKTDAFKLSNDGVKEFRRIFGYEPKIFSSLDKLSHSIQIQTFYCHLIKDMINRNSLDDIYIIEEKNKINFLPHKTVDFFYKNKERQVISDAFGIYKYSGNKGIAFFLEIENSDRRSTYVAKKTLDNYEGYYISGKWREEKWQPKNTKIFPPVLIIAYSEWKCKEILRQIKDKRKIENLNYFFTYYKAIKDEGISGNIWYNINGDKIKIIS
jgi:hypothetical protein